MEPERWQQIDQLLGAALERRPEERADFLDLACAGDESLRREVESLLRADEAAKSFIEAPTVKLVAEVLAEQHVRALVGQCLSHYKILSQLGAGGMGEVYLAEDLKLSRKVAIKFLPPALMADEQARRRLLREARAAAALDHPNICTIYEVGDEAGYSFIIMQYIEGETLAARLERGRLELGEALAIAIQVAEALQEAHRHEIIHRDIKPQNLMLTARGQVKVLDFGLAKMARERVVESNEADTLCQMSTPGAVVGTVPYMSPEQVRGERLDVRSDIFSFGTTLYEMLSGRRPFEAKSAAEIFAAILTQEVPPLEQAEAPEELSRIVRRCLEKDREQRYQTAREVVTDLENVQRERAPTQPTRRRMLLAVAGLLASLLLLALALNVGRLRERLSGGSGAPAQTIRLAVLPFENLTGDPEQEYFSDGLTEEMIAQLGRLHPLGLAVIARTSSMHYKKSGKTIEQIGNELRVDYILEGSARHEASRVRINARLIRVRDQTQVWTDTYEREQREILVLQAEVARAIAQQIRVQVSPVARLARPKAVDPEAYEAYLNALVQMAKSSPADTEIAFKYFNLALEKDPEFALGYTGIAFIWLDRGFRGVVSPKEAGIRATEAINRSLELDSTDARVQAASGYVNTWVHSDWAAAETAFRRALDINPSHAGAHLDYARLLQILRRPGEAMAHIEQAIELDPHRPGIHSVYGYILFYEGRYDDAIAQCLKSLETTPNDFLAHAGLSEAYYQIGKYPAALEHWKALYAVIGRREVVEALDRGYAEAGYARAMVLAAEKLAALPRIAPFNINIAFHYAHAGKTDEALAWLEKTYDAREPDIHILHLTPAFASLRSEPRFRELLRRMNIPQN